MRHERFNGMRVAIATSPTKAQCNHQCICPSGGWFAARRINWAPEMASHTTRVAVATSCISARRKFLREKPVARCVDGAVEALGEVMDDEDRYNRFYAGLALRRMDSEEARELLLDALFTARWCPLTTGDTLY